MQKKHNTPACVSKKMVRFRSETLAKKKKWIRISRSDPVLVFHMAVTAITAGTKPLPIRLHHVCWGELEATCEQKVAIAWRTKPWKEKALGDLPGSTTVSHANS